MEFKCTTANFNELHEVFFYINFFTNINYLFLILKVVS